MTEYNSCKLTWYVRLKLAISIFRANAYFVITIEKNKAYEANSNIKNTEDIVFIVDRYLDIVNNGDKLISDANKIINNKS